MYQTSNAFLSLGDIVASPWTWAKPVKPGRTLSREAVSSG